MVLPWSAMAEGGTDSTGVSSEPAASTAAVNQLAQHCEERWQHLQKLQNELAATCRPNGAVPQDATAAILSANEQALLAYIGILKEKSTEALPDSPSLHFEVLRKGLEDSVQATQETLSLAMDQKKEMLAEIRRAERMQSQLSQVQQTLDEKLQAVQLPDADHNPSEKIRLKELSERNAQVLRYSRTVMKQMADFVNKHFPAPTKDQIKDCKAKRKRKASSDGTLQDNNSSIDGTFQSLQEMLERLMNRCIESPHDPYIDLDETYWLPYIELLLRSGIGLRHPQDDQRMKLAPFHI